MSATTSFASAADSFSQGDYASAALFGAPDDWQTWAARGLICADPGVGPRLEALGTPEGRFYAAVVSWLNGEDARAVRGLETIDLPHARNLLALLRKPRIRVLAQCDRGSQWDFITSIRKDPRFDVVNYGFNPNDQPNRPYADVRRFFDEATPPDFYVSKMLEWHLLPPNLQDLPCPIFGHTADYDLHIQAALPWFGLFDELLTTDQTEWRDVRQLVPGPVSVFPKAFGLAMSPPPCPDARRALDVFISGTTQHPYHPDKARLLHQVLRQTDLSVKFIEGFLMVNDYLTILGKTRAAFTYIRHPGGMPTRGLESLAMGAAVAVQKESILRAYLGEEDGILPYSLDAGDLPDVLRRIRREWDVFGPAAQQGARRVRSEFGAEVAASQYFRFLTFLAAKPREARKRLDPGTLRQKRSIFCKGWAWRPGISRAVRQRSVGEWLRDVEQQDSPRPLIDAVREIVLEQATAAHLPTALNVLASFNTRVTPDHSLLARALELSRAGMARYPKCLVLRFNAIRAALHLGTRAEVTEALGWLHEALSLPTGSWVVRPEEDVFPWDFFSQFFNYREYFDTCTRAHQTGEEASPELTRLVLASMAYYASWHETGQAPEADAARRRQHALQASRLDPAFPFYSLRAARLLIESRGPGSDRDAEGLLVRLADESMLHDEASQLLERLVQEGRSRDERVEGLLAKARLTRERIHRTAVGTDDWSVVPLRAAAAPVSPAPVDVAGLPPGPATPDRRPRILYLCLEFAQWQHARRLAYPAGLGMEEGFRANGVDYTILPAICGLSKDARQAWQQQVRALCEGSTFDQVWVELVHSEWEEEFWHWLAGLAPVRVGLVMESLRYEPEVYAQSPNFLQRQAHVERRLEYVTHALCIDEADALELNQRQVVKAVWWPQAVPGRLILDQAPETPDTRAVFSGSVYGARHELLGQAQLASLLSLSCEPEEDATRLPALFDEAHRAWDAHLAGGGTITPGILSLHLESWRRIRTSCYELWLRGLQTGASVVNLPSYVRGYAGRVYEAMAAGRPVISWRVVDRPRTESLFTDGEEILLFPRENPAALASQIAALRGDRGRREALVRNAQARVRQAHTVERRVRQILDWVATGEEPEFRDPAGQVPAATPVPTADLPAVLPPGSAPFLRALGEIRRVQGEPAAAIAALEAATLQAPNDLPTRLALAGAAVDTEDWGRATVALSAAVNLDPRGSSVLQALSAACRRAGEFDLATRVTQPWSSRLPDDLGGLTERCLAALQQGALPASARPGQAVRRDWEPIVAVCTEAAARAQAQPTTTGVPVVALIGSLDGSRAALAAGDRAGAWRLAVEAVTGRPFHPEGWLLLARIASEAGDLPRARACAEKGRELAPKWAPARDFAKALGRGGAKPTAREGTVPLEALPEAWLKAGTRPRLSVCIITKNEERFIAQCLRSVQGVADQVVVLDTGSTDRTVTIAREMGAEVHTFTWCDDFSAARNACLAHARGEWILGLDADEELLPESRVELQKAMKSSGTLAWRIRLVDAGKEAEGCHYLPRLFRNAPGVYYAGRIHEHPFGSLQRMQAEWGMENRLGSVTLRHHGYADQVVKDRSKIQRNLRLLEQAVQESPGDTSLLMSYGLDLIRSGQLDAGLEEYGRAFKVMSAQPPATVPPELRERLLTLMTTHLMTAQRFQSVVELSGTPLAQATGPTASLHLMFGVACFVQKRHAEAAVHMQQCIAKRNSPALSPIHRDITGGGPRHLLALCHGALGQNVEAEREFLASLAEEPGVVKVQLDLARFLDGSGRPVKALEQLYAIVQAKPSEQTAWRLGAEIALREVEFRDVAVDWTAEALRRFPRDPVLGCARARVLLLADQPAAALPVWLQYHDSSNPQHLAALVMCELLGEGTARQFSTERESVVSQECCGWFKRLIDHGAEGTVRAIGDRIPQLGAVLPHAAAALRAVFEDAQVA